MANSDDMQAINEYLMTTPVKTAAAEEIKQSWMEWWHDHSDDWYYTDNDYDHARNVRNTFNIANTVSSTEKATVQQQIAQGLTTEEMQGQTKRAGTSGMFYEEPSPLIPQKFKVYGFIAAGIIGVGYAAKKLLSHTPFGMALNKLF